MLEIGFCKGNITPPIGTPLSGYENRPHNALAIHDDLYARCTLFHETETDTYVALIVCDLLWVNYTFTDEIKRIIERETSKGKIKAENVIIHAIHTHAAQRIVGGLDFFFHPVRKKRDVDSGWYLEHAIPYLQRVIASTVWGALYDLQPVTIKCGRALTDTAHNRRYGDPGAQFVDRELFVALFLSEDARPTGENIRGIFYNLANHCVALGEQNALISADWPFFAGEVLKATYNLSRTCQVTFGQATAGNTNPYNCRFGDENRVVKDAENVGQQVGSDVIRALREEQLSTITRQGEARRSTLRLIRRTIDIEVTDEEKRKFFETYDLDFIGFLKKGDHLLLEVRIALLQVNNWIIVAIPGEPFGEFGIRIKEIVRKQNPSFIPIVLELCDGAVSYIPTRDSYNNVGGYEVSIAASPETGYRILDTVEEMIRTL